MLYTSYFGKLKKLPKNVIPVSIAAVTPNWFEGRSLKQFAPSMRLLDDYKYGRINADGYTRRYYEEIRNVNLLDIKHELSLLAKGESVWDNPDLHIALLCYEKPEDFCHRHLVADWFNSAGIQCEEFSFEGK